MNRGTSDDVQRAAGLKMKASTIRLLSLVACAALVAPSLAQTFNPTTGTSAWNVNANWTPAVFPNAVGASATFVSPTGTQTVNLTQAITVGTINVTNNGANVFTLANGGGSLLFDVSSGNAQFNIGGTSSTVANVTVSSSITLNDTLQVTHTNNAPTGTTGALFSGTITGNGGFIKDGPGRLGFSATAKTYTGATTINQGRLRVSGNAQMTATSSILVNNGGSLYLDENLFGNWSFGGGTALVTINGDGDNGGGVGTQGALRLQNNGLGAHNFANAVALGSDATIHVEGVANLMLNGGISGSSILTKSGNGTLNFTAANAGLTGGTRVTNGTLLVNAGSQLGTGNLTMGQVSGANPSLVLNNAAQTVSNLTSTFTNVSGTQTHAITLNGTALNILQTANTSYGVGAVSTLTSTIGGLGSVTLNGASTGTLRLTNGNTYSGGTTVNGGKLYANNLSGSATGTGAVNVAANGTVGGFGSIASSAVTVAGTIEPGDGVGVLTMNAPVSMTNGSVFEWQVNNAAPAIALPSTGGSDSLGLQDRLDITGVANTLTAGSITLKIVESATPSFTIGQTYSWTVVTSQGTPSITSYAFDLTAAPTFLSNGGSGALQLAISGNNVYLNFTPVPEPTTLMALTVAGLGAGQMLRRRFGKKVNSELA